MRPVGYTRDGPREDSVTSLTLDPTNDHVIVTVNSYDPQNRQNDVFVLAIGRQTGSSGSLDAFDDATEPTDSTALGKEDGSFVFEVVLFTIIVILALLLVAIIVLGAGYCLRRRHSTAERPESDTTSVQTAYLDPPAGDKPIV